MADSAAPAWPQWATVLSGAQQALAGGAPLRSYFYGPDGYALHNAAVALADQLQRSLLVIDFAQAVQANPERAALSRLISAACRHAWLHDALLCFTGIDSGQALEVRQLLDQLSAPICLFTGAQAYSFDGVTGRRVLSVPFDASTVAQRWAAWRRELVQHALPDTSAATLAAASN